MFRTNSGTVSEKKNVLGNIGIVFKLSMRGSMVLYKA